MRTRASLRSCCILQQDQDYFFLELITQELILFINSECCRDWVGFFFSFFFFSPGLLFIFCTPFPAQLIMRQMLA